MLADMALQGRDNYYIGDGTARFDLVHVNAVAYGHICAANHLSPVNDKVYLKILFNTTDDIESEFCSSVDTNCSWQSLQSNSRKTGHVQGIFRLASRSDIESVDLSNNSGLYS